MFSNAKVPTWIVLFRLIAFLLPCWYLGESLVNSFLQDTGFGGYWRWLTIWTLTANFLVAGSMLIQCFRPGQWNWHVLATVAIAMNFNVLFSYWSLYFTDPTLVQGDTQIPLHRQMYLHIAMIFIQWFDAFALHRIWLRWKKVIGLHLAVFLGYSLWIELFLRPLSDKPVGSVTSGLPYPFLNDMVLWPERVTFYGGSLVMASVVLAVAWGISRLSNRWRAGDVSGG